MTGGETNTLASRGLEEPAHALRVLEEPFFQLCCCVSFWFWREIGFGSGARSLLRPEKKVLVVCLAGAQSILQPEKKVLVVCLVGARSLLRLEKKDTVVCLAGARSLLRPEKKSSSCLSGGCAIKK